MKLYVISGLAADFQVLEKIKFPQSLEAVSYTHLDVYKRQQ